MCAFVVNTGYSGWVVRISSLRCLVIPEWVGVVGMGGIPPPSGVHTGSWCVVRRTLSPSGDFSNRGESGRRVDIQTAIEWLYVLSAGTNQHSVKSVG